MEAFTPTRAVKITSRKKRPTTLPFGRKAGPLTLGPNRPVGKDGKYFARCTCGHQGWYAIEELEKLVYAKSGCGQPKCNALTFREAIWNTPESLRLQLFTLITLYPQELESYWGGTFDDLYELSFEDAYLNFAEALDGVAGKWVTRVDPELPLIEGNVTLGAKPDRTLTSLHRVKVDVDGVPMRMKELCQLSGLGAYELLMKLYKRGSTDDLLFTLLEGDL